MTYKKINERKWILTLRKKDVYHESTTENVTDKNIKYDGGVLKLMVVGKDFFRKGGVEILRALDDLIVNNIELTIVSSLSFDPCIKKRITIPL